MSGKGPLRFRSSFLNLFLLNIQKQKQTYKKKRPTQFPFELQFQKRLLGKNKIEVLI